MIYLPEIPKSQNITFEDLKKTKQNKKNNYYQRT